MELGAQRHASARRRHASVRLRVAVVFLSAAGVHTRRSEQEFPTTALSAASTFILGRSGGDSSPRRSAIRDSTRSLSGATLTAGVAPLRSTPEESGYIDADIVPDSLPQSVYFPGFVEEAAPSQDADGLPDSALYASEEQAIANFPGRKRNFKTIQRRKHSIIFSYLLKGKRGTLTYYNPINEEQVSDVQRRIVEYENCSIVDPAGPSRPITPDELAPGDHVYCWMWAARAAYLGLPPPLRDEWDVEGVKDAVENLPKDWGLQDVKPFRRQKYSTYLSGTYRDNVTFTVGCFRPLTDRHVEELERIIYAAADFEDAFTAIDMSMPRISSIKLGTRMYFWMSRAIGTLEQVWETPEWSQSSERTRYRLFFELLYASIKPRTKMSILPSDVVITGKVSNESSWRAVILRDLPEDEDHLLRDDEIIRDLGEIGLRMSFNRTMAAVLVEEMTSDPGDMQLLDVFADMYEDATDDLDKHLLPASLRTPIVGNNVGKKEGDTNLIYLRQLRGLWF